MNRTQMAILVGVWATFSLDLFSALTSSPQTTEINAHSRAPTLMKWVKLSLAVAVAAGLAGSVIEGSPVPLVATTSVAVAMYFLYVHARDSGLANGGASTEQTAETAATLAPLAWSFA